MQYEYGSKITNFIQEIMLLRDNYEKTLEHDDNFKLLLECIDYYNINKINKETIIPTYFGEGYMEINNDLICEPDIEEIDISESSDDTNSVSESSSDYFHSSEEENDEDLDHISKLNEMRAIANIYLNRSIKANMLTTEPVKYE